MHGKTKEKRAAAAAKFILNPRKWANGCQFVRQHKTSDRPNTPYLKQLTRKVQIFSFVEIFPMQTLLRFLFLCASEE